jgi:hypothetical protein
MLAVGEAAPLELAKGAALVCETSISGFESRQSPQMEGAAEWTATGLENQGRSHLGVFPAETLALAER